MLVKTDRHRVSLGFQSLAVTLGGVQTLVAETVSGDKP